MRRRRRHAAWVAVVGLAAAGCGRGAAPQAPEVVARIGGNDVRYEEFGAYVERQLGERGSGLSSDVLSRLFDRFVDERLLADLAVERGLVPAGSDLRVAVDRLLGAEEDGEPSAAEVETWYRDHEQELERPERVRLRQILVDDRATAERALADIAAGADFADVAKRYSRDPSAAAGGAQGELARDELPPVFADAIFRLEPGEVSEIFEADYGFHLFQVVERLPAAAAPLAAVRDEIRSRLRQQRADLRLAALAAEARDRYNVAVFGRNLPFNYQGRYLADDP